MGKSAQFWVGAYRSLEVVRPAASTATAAARRPARSGAASGWDALAASVLLFFMSSRSAALGHNWSVTVGRECALCQRLSTADCGGSVAARRLFVLFGW